MQSNKVAYLHIFLHIKMFVGKEEQIEINFERPTNIGVDLEVLQMTLLEVSSSHLLTDFKQ